MIIEGLGGKIGFESEQETTFYFYLPEFYKTEKEPEKIAVTKEKLLICEEDPDIAHFIGLVLEKEGYQTDIAYSIKEGMRFLKNNHYQGMILDLLLPDEDSLSFIHQLRNNTQTIDMPIVVISGKSSEEKKQIEEVKNIRITSYLDKPVNAKKLLDAMHRITKNKNSLPRILYIEDDRDTVQVITVLLQKKAFIIPAHTFSEAEEKIRLEEFDLVLLDLLLPDGNGAKLLELLSIQSNQVPVIIFTSHEAASDLRTKVEEILIKSKISNKELIHKVESALEKSKNRDRDRS